MSDAVNDGRNRTGNTSQLKVGDAVLAAFGKEIKSLEH